MAGSTKNSVHEIFHSMESGPEGASSTNTAQAWLDHRSRSLGLFIDGKLVVPADRPSRSLTDCEGAQLCSVMVAGDEDVSVCSSSSVIGFKSWSELSCSQRAKVMLRMVGVLGQHAVCVSEVCDVCEAACPPASLIRLLQFYSSWAQLRDALMPSWTPRGVVLVVGSDDCSLQQLMIKVLPALAMGNSVIVVPGLSSAPPALLLAELFSAAGLPAGALNVLTGSDTLFGAKVAANQNISYVTFSGNKQEGVLLCEATAGLGVSVSVSSILGARCPFIVFESADIDSAVDAIVQNVFTKRREVHWVLCVQESVQERLVSRLRLRMSGMKSLSLRSEEERRLVEAAVQEAEQQGATLVQSCSPPSSGAQYPPTVILGSAPSSPCVVAPPPGPLLPLLTFRSNSEAVALANHSPHGLAASIWTEELTLALETAKSVCVGSVCVNSVSLSDPSLPVSPHKESGSCTDGGQEGLYQFLRPSSSSSPPLPRSSPLSMDYSQFGSAAPPTTIIPADSASTPKSLPQFVGGKSCKSVSGCSLKVQAADGAVLAFCPDGGRKDVRNAVEAAVKVQPGWMKKSASARAQSLFSLAKGLEAKRRDLSASINTQTGLSLDKADEEVELSIARLNDWAAYCDKLQGGTPSLPLSGSALSLPEALGVVGVVLPDENPLLSMVTLLGAAISFGNAVILIPSEKNPLPALTFIQVLQASDLPAGLVNIITGYKDQLTVSLANHSVIKAIWYWGSAEGCQFVQHSCSAPLKTLLLSIQQKGGERGRDWTHPSILEEMGRNAVQWKSIWIPTA
ncbi:aldehyde dehydrogenase family 16 member A1 [Gymnodraco acuticeps]|uniref:Aldehyde dehydrogenase family 16 member A1 n=1 Tax=Gymnodraco acuticeps TaxID=8218 RepID=A0A6P8WXF0_GYMAC|nr:aldehyde dehydrogenase family 16 member A1 [Gymnodraco acuticeps]